MRELKFTIMFTTDGLVITSFLCGEEEAES